MQEYFGRGLNDEYGVIEDFEPFCDESIGGLLRRKVDL